MENYFLYILIALGLVYYFYNSNQKSKLAMEKINNGAVVIDVRTQDEFNSGNYKNSINIPLNTINSKIEEIKSFKEEIVVVCASGNRSGQAKDILKDFGIEVINGGSWANLK